MLNIIILSDNSVSTTCKLTGKLNDDSVSDFDMKVNLLIHDNKLIVMDLSELELITSAGIGAFIKIKTSLAKRNGELAIVNMPNQIKKVFEIVKLLPAMNVFQNTKELDDYLVRIQQRMLQEGSFDSHA